MLAKLMETKGKKQTREHPEQVKNGLLSEKTIWNEPNFSTENEDQ